MSSITPYSALGLAISTSERDESEVEEAEWRGESEGETAADSVSVAVVEVTVRLRAGFCLGRAEVDAILKEGIRPTEEKVEMPNANCSRGEKKGGGRKTSYEMANGGQSFKVAVLRGCLSAKTFCWGVRGA